MKNSSARKKLSYSLPLYIRHTARFLEFISPGLALHFALKLFFTPLRFPRPSREIGVYQQAIKHSLHTRESKFTVLEWRGSGPKVLLMHGWSGRGTQFFKLIEQLRQQDLHIYSIEAPAHGDSKQKKTHMLEFVDAIEICSDRFGTFEGAIGHSLGGMALFNAMDRNLQARKIVLMGVPASIENVVADFCKRLGNSPGIAGMIIKYIENKYSMETGKASTKFLAGKHNPAGLIIHDVDDLDIDVNNAEEIKKKWPNATLFITEGKGHRKVLVDSSIIDAIIGFLGVHG